MPELPLELCQMVVDEVASQSDLLALLLVSIKFKSATERRLYRTISFLATLTPSDVIKKWGVFERICACPRVAAHVLHLTITLEDKVLPPSSDSDASSYLAQAFLSIPNLKSLDINLSSTKIQSSFQVHVPFLLHTFSAALGSSSAFAQRLEPFLEAQVELKDLSFFTSAKITLTASALPKLATVFGEADFIREIVPGRPVTRVCSVGQGKASPFNGSCIRNLYLMLLLDLQWYTHLFPTLTFLQCVSWNDNFTLLFPNLGYLSALEKLHIILARVEWTDEKELDFVDLVFGGCSSLTYIEVNVMGDYKSKIWTRGARTGTESVWDPNEWRKR